MEEFVVEKYIEINKFMPIQILVILVLQDDGIDRERVRIFLAKGRYQKG